MSRLLVIIPDRLSDLVAKGEVQPRYYNPGNVFDEVTILSTTPDEPDRDSLQYMIGDAKLDVAFYSDNLSLVTSWPESVRRWRLQCWAKEGVEIVRRVQPDLIRCHGADWNLYLASRAKKELGVPYVVSLHINPDVNPVRRYVSNTLGKSERWHNRFYEYIEQEGLRNADLVMPVYRPILPYLARKGVVRTKVCYNVLNGLHLEQKSDYSLAQPRKLICVGRLLEEKNPVNIILAVRRLPDTELLIVGDGPKRAELEALVSRLGVGERVRFAPAVRNDELCRMLPTFDIFVVHTEYWEINKSVLEALLTGLPVVINRRDGEAVAEFERGDFVQLVENTEESYFAAIRSLLEDDAGRADLGRRAFAHAQAYWAPEKTEAVYAGIYRQFLDRKNAA